MTKGHLHLVTLERADVSEKLNDLEQNCDSRQHLKSFVFHKRFRSTLKRNGSAFVSPAANRLENKRLDRF